MTNENNSLQALDPRLPIGSLEAYLHYVNQIPMLTAEEEHDLRAI
jgi:RNA polymerase sigma-32 factor